MAGARKRGEKGGWAFATCVAIVKPPLLAFTKRQWIDGHKLPAEGGCVVVSNHVSHVDPFTFAHFVYENGRIPRYLAKREVFDVPVGGRLVAAAGQIPVYRLTTDASQAFRAAVAAVEEGKCVVVYPEGTISRDPDLWPMVGRTGAARIALSTGCPVIPVAQWGANHILPPYAKKPSLLPRKTVTVKAGDPVDLEDPARCAADAGGPSPRDGADHGRGDPAAREHPARVGSRNTVRPEARRCAGDRQPPRDRPQETQEGRRTMSKVAVFGAGSWGTAFSIVLADAGNEVTIWGRREEVCAAINDGHENTEYLQGIELPSSISATHDPERALHDAEYVVLAVPSQTLRTNLTEWAGFVPRDAVLVSLMKGVERGSLQRMSEVIAEVTGAGPERIGVVSGPNLAKEIARREPAASVVACADEVVAKRLQDMCHAPAFRPYTSTDVVGCELGGAYKNVIGLGVGMAIGLGFGDNTTASVITRGLAEIARLATALGANPLTLMGLAGLGDLVATCSSPLSRNRTFGEKLGQGMTTEEVTASMRQVAEGVKSCKSLLDLAARTGVDAPIVNHVNNVIEGRLSAGDMVTSLISRETKAERE